jgi:hypothetical protein
MLLKKNMPKKSRNLFRDINVVYLSIQPRSSIRMKKKSSPAPATGNWTFLTNHAHVVILLAGETDLPLREVASRVGITERAVQRIVADLEASGVLSHIKVGRKNSYSVNSQAMLRHPIESHCSVGSLLKMVHA